MSIPNIYHLRRVADTAAKACSICYKPSSCVLITPDNKVCMLFLPFVFFFFFFSTYFLFITCTVICRKIGRLIESQGLLLRMRDPPQRPTLLHAYRRYGGCGG